MLQSVVLSRSGMHSQFIHINAANRGYSLVRSMINYSLILLFAFAFSVQQFAAFAYTAHANRSDKKSSALRLQQLVNSPHFSSYYTPEVNPLECIMEFAEEDEEASNKKNSIEVDAHCFPAAFGSVELDFTLSQKSRFIHLTELFKRQPSIPLFILHRSWKTYLS